MDQSTSSDVDILHKNGNAVPFPFTIVEFFTRDALDDCSMRFERIQPPSSRLFELWLQGLERLARNTATNAMAATRHDEIDVVGPCFARAYVAERQRRASQLFPLHSEAHTFPDCGAFLVGAHASGIRSSFAIIVQDRLSGMQTPRWGVPPPALALSKFDVVPEFRGPLPEILVVSLKQDVTGVTCCRSALM
jgi:hypothetical protein